MLNIFSKIFLFLFLFSTAAFAEVEVENKSVVEDGAIKLAKEKEEKEHELELLSEITEFEKTINENIWFKRYEGYLNYLQFKKEISDLDRRIKRLSKKRSKQAKSELSILKTKREIRISEIELLKDYEESAVGKFVKPQEIKDIPEVTNPFMIITALSYMKQLEEQNKDYTSNYEEVQELLMSLNILQDRYDEYKKIDRIKVDKSKQAISDFELVLDIFSTTHHVYNQKIEEINLSLTKQIKDQTKRALYLLIAVLIIIALAVFTKILIKKYMTEHENFYAANKAVNFILVVMVLLVVLFEYIDNVSYLVTFLGFASAGIAIAMKDWFMSILGWFVIIMGGSIHVGDRIRIKQGNHEYVGDVLDVSLLRITLHEDVTLTTYLENRRAGRVIFIPNNFIFTDMIANYSHSGLKTVWDGIDITITFDSNHQKAQHIVKETTRKLSKGYTDITRKQLNRIRSKYNLRSTNVDPRVFSFIEPNGVRISAWYQTSAFATLTLRSTISVEIVEAFNKEDDITIAFPTQTINVGAAATALPPKAPEGALV